MDIKKLVQNLTKSHTYNIFARLIIVDLFFIIPIFVEVDTAEAYILNFFVFTQIYILLKLPFFLYGLYLDKRTDKKIKNDFILNNKLFNFFKILSTIYQLLIIAGIIFVYIFILFDTGIENLLYLMGGLWGFENLYSIGTFFLYNYRIFFSIIIH